MADNLGAPLLERITPKLLPELKAYLERHRAELLGMLGRPETAGIPLARRHTKIMDGLLTSLFPAAYAAMKKQRRWAAVSLAAVGGYGRGLVAVKSDLDVRLLTNESAERVRPIAEALLYPLWDAGVSIGHQVVTVNDALETARHDLPTATALLDWRPIAGDPEFGKSLHERAYAGIFSDGELPSFVRRLETEVGERHQRFGGSVYLLEPDVKNGAGGLRDLDIALWAARARWRVQEFTELVRVGVLLPREAADIGQASEFIWSVRNHLHQHAGRRSDRLTFEEQELIAQAMGYDARVQVPADESVEPSGPMVEAFMSDYYRHARVITRLREQILSRATPRVSRKKPHEEQLGQGLRTFDGQITLADPSEAVRDPSLVFQLYTTALARNLPVLPFARDTVARLAGDPGFAEALRSSKEASSLFVDLVCAAQETRFRNNSVLSELHDIGLLLAMIPEFNPVVGRVHHDTYHVYTVDVHSVAAVDRLRALVRGDLAQEFPLACRLAAEVSRPAVLFLATLLHDVGKAIGGKDHSRRGAEMARPILTRLGLPPEDVDEGCHLIFQHLVMYHVAARRDLEDPGTIAEFCREVHGREGLRDLYLLTVADLSTTSPTSMTSWKARMLDELFLATDVFLAGEGTTLEARSEKARERVREAWPSPDRAFFEQYAASMPERYFLSNTPAEIVAHAEVARTAEGQLVQAALAPSRHPEAAELCVVTLDRPGLLASLTAVITASRLEVHRAEIHSRTLANGSVQAVDLFWLRDRVYGADGVARCLPKLQADFNAVLSGKVTPQELAVSRASSPWSERHTPNVATEVSIDNRASPRHTVIEVLTRDRAGLLFTLANQLHELGLVINVAKINTEGTKVADVFYVSEADGSKMDSGTRTRTVREAILAVLRRVAEDSKPS